MPLQQEQRHIYYDNDLNIEAYNLSGIVQKFPNHFHECYVIGFIEGGGRHMWCKGREYNLKKGDLILFNPKENHTCEPIDGEILDYRAINININVMEKAAKEIIGQSFAPYFKHNVVPQCEITILIKELYDLIVKNASKIEKEETFYFLLEQILHEYASSLEEKNIYDQNDRIKILCEYIEEHYFENITLDELASCVCLSKYYLLRYFTKEMKVSPYQYLKSIRIENAKKMLEEGILPVEAAINTGFSDQSHFTKSFKELIGLTPKQYQKIFINKE